MEQLRAVDYLRVSTEEQARGYGITYTGKRTAAYIERKGWSHVGTYPDEGFSGSLEAKDRPALTRLMADARKTPRPFDMVVVNEGRGIGRTGRAFWRWVWELEDLGVFVAVVKKDYDNSTQAGRSQMRKDADYAEEERELIRDRTQGGIQEKAEEGGWPSGVPPYGWCIENQGVKGESRPAIHDGEAVVLRRMLELRLERRSYARMAEVLAAEGSTTRNGLPWTEASVRRTLLAEVLTTNKVIFRKPGQVAEDREGRPLYGRPVEIPLPPIFTDQEIADLQRVIRQGNGSRTPQRDGAVYPVSGRLIGLCGAHYTGYWRKDRDHRMYRCTGKCSCSQIDADALEERLWQDVCRLLGSPEQLQAMSEDWAALTGSTRINTADRIAELDQQIEEQLDTIALTTRMAAKQAAGRRLDPEAAEAAVERAVRPLQKELDDLEKQRAEVVSWQRENEAAATRAADLQQLAELARTQLQDLTPLEQREVIQLLDLRVYIIGSVPPRPSAGSPTAWFQDRDRPVPELDDEAWAKAQAVIRRLDSGRGPERMPERPALTGILLKAVTGCRWRDIPAECGKPHSIRQRWNRWIASGAWDQIMDALEGMPGLRAGVLPPMVAEGRLDPRSLIGAPMEPEITGSVEPVRSGVIRIRLTLAA